MYAMTMTARGARMEQQLVQGLKTLLWVGFVFMVMALVFIEPAFATGTGTGTGTGGAGAAQTRITNVARGWQNIVQGIGVVILIIAWSYVGYQIAFGGKTMKDMGGVAIGSSVAGLAPVLVGWMFS